MKLALADILSGKHRMDQYDGLSAGRGAWAEIDLDAIAHNVRQIRAHAGPDVEFIAVVKSNAYGHGAIPVALAALQAGATRLAVACVDEGIELRSAGISAPVLVMGHVCCEEAQAIVANGLTATVDSVELAKRLSSVAQQHGTELAVHLKVDTGMHRLGVEPDVAAPLWQAISNLSNLYAEGLYTHFSRADEVDPAPTLDQLSIFDGVCRAIHQRGLQIPIRHASNTAAALSRVDVRLNAVRCGIGLLGLAPARALEGVLPLRAALSMKARFARVHAIKAGDAVGYGGDFVCERSARIGLLPLGYADGLPRAVSNGGTVLVHGRHAPIVGRVSMDQLTVLLDHTDTKPGDEAVVIGSQGFNAITAANIARSAGTIDYEVLARIPPRLPRKYLRHGKVIAWHTLNNHPAACAFESTA